MQNEHKNTAESIFKQHSAAENFKAQLGNRGLYDQSKKNERFYAGDQWHGAKVSKSQPLIIHNLIKRIGEYKMAVIGSAPVTANYSAEGVPNTLGMRKNIDNAVNNLSSGSDINTIYGGMSEDEQLNLVMSCLSDYYDTTAERVNFTNKCTEVMRKAFITGTGILFTYWDEYIKTGLYADEAKSAPIKGDIAIEVLDVENVDFGDPNITDIQKQPYIIIVKRRSVKEVKDAAKRYGVAKAVIDSISPDEELDHLPGDRSETQQEGLKKCTVLLKLWKDGDTVKGIEAVKSGIVRPEWDLNINLYPISILPWEQRTGCIYGDSEITTLIPNQIAINRMLSANIYSMIMNGMPIMMVNNEVLIDTPTNDPAQIVQFSGTNEDFQNAIKYINPPTFSPQISNCINDLIQNTMSVSGANDAALGNMRPDNASAYIALREAATTPLQLYQNRYYSFVEQVARIWCEMWIKNYGKRLLKISDESGVWYFPFDADKFRDAVISCKIDVGASTLWSEAQVISTLDNLLAAQLITPKEYLERLPKGVVPNSQSLIKTYAAKEETASMQQNIQKTAMQSLPPEYQAQFAQLPAEIQQQMLSNAGGTE